MKRFIRIALCSVLVLCIFLPGLPANAAPVQVRVTLPALPVTLNGMQIENAGREYPLIVYKGITYFPMTYYDSGFLGLEAKWTPHEGLVINKIKRTIVPWPYNGQEASSLNPQTATAQLAAFPISVNGKVVENDKEEYPLLIYKGITYFPLTWRFAVDEFGWEYNYYDTAGLFIKSVDEKAVVALLNELFGDSKRDIVRYQSEQFRTSEWASYTFRSSSFSGAYMRAKMSEHRPAGSVWYRSVDTTIPPGQNPNPYNPLFTSHFLKLESGCYKSADGKRWEKVNDADVAYPWAHLTDLHGLLMQIPDSAYDSAFFGYGDGYARMYIEFFDETPTSMPSESADGSMAAGSIRRHAFYIDLSASCLRSYQSSSLPFYFGEDGELNIINPPHYNQDFIDLDYEPVIFPVP